MVLSLVGKCGTQGDGGLGLEEGEACRLDFQPWTRSVKVQQNEKPTSSTPEGLNGVC